MLASEPVFAQPAPARKVIPDAYSEAPGDGMNRVAQAGHAAAHHAEAAQNLQAKGASKFKRVDDAELKQLVAEENASRTKFSRYPGLERWELLEKMGDGAFSNVYRARDLQGDHGQVAIKVVRKYEMNNMQVSVSGLSFVYLVLFLHLSLSSMLVCCRLHPLCLARWTIWDPNMCRAQSGTAASCSTLRAGRARESFMRRSFQHSNLGGLTPSNRETNIYIRTSRESPKLQRCEKTFFASTDIVARWLVAAVSVSLCNAARSRCWPRI